MPEITPLELKIKDSTICNDQPIDVSVPDIWFSYQWSTGSMTPSARIDQIGQYWLEVTNICGQIFRDSFMVSSITPSVLQLPDTIIGCEFGIILLNASNKFKTYRWNDLSIDSIYTVYQSGKYWVEVTDHCGQIQSDTCFVQLENDIQLSLPDTLHICEGDSVSLSIDFYKNISWTPQFNISCHNCPVQTFFPDISSNYYVYVISEDGCSSSDSVYIQVVEEITLMDSITICEGDSIFIHNDYYKTGSHEILIPSNSGCDTNLILLISESQNYIYEPNVIASCPNSNTGRIDFRNITNSNIEIVWQNTVFTKDTSIINLSPGVYEYTLIFDENCESFFQLEIPVYDDLNYKIDVVSNSCDSPRMWMASFRGLGFEKVLITKDGVEQEGKDFTFTEAGDYHVFIQDTNGCTLLDSILVLNQQSEFSYSLPDTLCIYNGQTAFALIEGDTSKIKYVEWLNGLDINCKNCNYLEARPSVSNDYRVRIIDKDGCEYVINTYVKVLGKEDIFVPNTFSPNGDNINDLFKPYSSNDNDHVTTFEVYSRWGELIYRESDVTFGNMKGWNGLFHGQELNPAVFVYFISAIHNDTEVLRTGSITLIK